MIAANRPRRRFPVNCHLGKCDRFHQLPEADVVVFGIWVEDEVASRHGVFFSRKDLPDRLAFVRQKPSEKELQELAANYFYLMDSGIVLFNERTTMICTERC